MATVTRIIDGVKVTTEVADILEVPSEIEAWQGKRVLVSTGLYDAMKTFVESSNDQSFQVMFEYSTTWRRDSDFINVGATALGLTQEQIDGMFIAASELE